MKKLYKKSNHGISLISLIITIIVIIILAAIVIFSGLNTPDRANFAKFAQNFSDYNTTIMGDYTKKKTQYAVSGQSRTDAQIYYIIATGNENSVDVNDAPTPVATIEKLGLNLHPEQLSGTEYYEITSDSNIEGINKQMQFYEAGEKHYVTDAGEAFVLPGYLVPGTNRWYINEKKYYESDEPIKGPFSFDISEWKLLSANDINSTEVEGKLEKENESAYIYFTATANGEPATISYTPSSGGETVNDIGKILLPISDNGEYNFTITAEVDGMQKTTTKKVTIADRFIQMTEASAFTYNSISSSKCEITGLTEYGKSLEIINIPSKINGKDVSSVRDNAFENCTNITSVIIPSTVSIMGNYSFHNCRKLESITIPSSVKSINEGAFSGCTSLTSVTIPANMRDIKMSLFYNCENLTSITIPSSVTSIGDSAFYNCRKLESIIIPSSVKSIANSAFRECSSLTNITIPSSVTSINSNAFKNCSGLTSITLPISLTSIGKYSFYGCRNLQEVYYAGTETQWNAITIESQNNPIINATKHYNSTGLSMP